MFYSLSEWETYCKVNDMYNPDVHKKVHEEFITRVNQFQFLKKHRDYIEQNHLGLGERSFWWQWFLLFRDKLPQNVLEIGVHKGAVLSLWGLIRTQFWENAPTNKQTLNVYGITPTDGAETGIQNTQEEIAELFYKFADKNLCNLTIHKGYSQDESSIAFAKQNLYDIVYIDGGHTEEIVQNDIVNYSPLVKVGGYLVIDDCSNRFKMPWGYFQGINSVSKVVDDFLPPITPRVQWEHVGVVVHNRVWRKVK